MEPSRAFDKALKELYKGPSKALKEPSRAFHKALKEPLRGLRMP